MSDGRSNGPAGNDGAEAAPPILAWLPTTKESGLIILAYNDHHNDMGNPNNLTKNNKGFIKIVQIHMFHGCKRDV
jgi:hypothetical protein